MSPLSEPKLKKRKIDSDRNSNISLPFEDISTRADQNFASNYDPLPWQAPDPRYAFEQTANDFIRFQKQDPGRVNAIRELAESIGSKVLKAETIRFSSLQDAEAYLHSQNVHPPLPYRRLDLSSLVDICFQPPSQFDFELALGTALVRPKTGSATVDVVVQIPSGFLHTKDYLDFRYFAKRALYISYLAVFLKKEQDTRRYRIEYLDGDQLRPILVSFCPEVNCVVRILPAIAAEFFPLQKLSPCDNRALRSTGNPTPLYNASIVADAYLNGNLELIKKYQKSQIGFEQSLGFGRYWLANNFFSACIEEGGFGGYEWALLQAHMLETGIIQRNTASQSTSSSAFSMFKAVLDFIANTDFVTSNSNSPEHLKRFYERADLPTCLLAKSLFNIFYKMCGWSYNALKYDARTTLAAIGPGIPLKSQFIRVFSSLPYENLRNSDLIVWLPITPLEEAEKASSLDRPATTWNVTYDTLNHLYESLSKGLGNRCKRIFFATRGTTNSTIEYHGSKPLMEIRIFLVLDDKQAGRLIDNGPDVDDAVGCAAFRAFWLERAELRRFKDGRVRETVVWDPSSPPVEQIIGYLYEKKLELGGKIENIRFYGSQFHRLLDVWTPTQTSTTLFNDALSDFHKIIDTMRELNGFPLQFKGIYALSSALRYTSVKPPMRGSIYPLEAEIEFESSPNWPENSEQKVRSELGLLLKLSSDLKATGALASVDVGLDSSQQNCGMGSMLRILTKNGYQFHFTLKPIKSRDFTAKDKTPMIGVITGNEELETIYLLREMIVQKAKQFEYFSTVIRLVKHWFNSHFLASYFMEEILDCFGALAFCLRFKHVTPGSTFNGFVRTMHELSQWDWRKHPLEVELSGNLSEEDRIEVLDRFDSIRAASNKSENVSISLVIPSQGKRIRWIGCHVPRVVATKMTKLARMTCNSLSAGFPVKSVLEQLFTPDLGYFDFIIHLRPTVSSSTTASRRYSNLVTTPTNNIISISKPFIWDLQQILGDCVILFPSQDHNMIGCLWKPARSSDLKLTPTLADCSPGVESFQTKRPALIYNKLAVLQKAQALGDGYIKSISHNLTE